MLGLMLVMFCTGWMCCWLCSFKLSNGNVRKWLGGHIHPYWASSALPDVAQKGSKR
jgi:hypothetical protein